MPTDLTPQFFTIVPAREKLELPISFRDNVEWGADKPEEGATRSKTFYQNSAPTGGYKPGDIWVDTDDNNHAYRANDAMAWVSIRDAAAGSVQTTIFYQSTAPSSGMLTNDYWKDSDDNKIYRFNGSNWLEVQDDGIATAISNAATAQTAANDAQSDATANDALLDDIADDAKITPVEKLTIKPLWDAIVAEKVQIDAEADTFGVSKTDFTTDYDALNLYLNTTVTVFGNMATTTTITRATWDTAWENYFDEKIKILNAISTAAKALADTAQAEADRKIITFVQASAPTAEQTGDIWYDSDDENKVYRWSGSAWTAYAYDVADWAKVTGAAKPDDNATDGAQAGDNLTDSGAGVLEDEDIIKYARPLYGDGSDGNLTTSSDVTLTADTYYDTLTISNGDTVYPSGYRLFCKTKLIIVSGGTLDRSGNDGESGIAPGNGAGGAALADANLSGSDIGGQGDNDGGPVLGNGADAPYSIGVNGAKGGGGTTPGSGGTAGTATASPTKPRSLPFCIQLIHIIAGGVSHLMDSSAGSGGGNSGSDAGSDGGGGASAGGVILIVAREIENAGVIQANGGDGGSGANGNNNGAGGGGGGSGGVIVLIYNKYSGAGTKTVTAGTGGAKGTGGISDGEDGDNGNTGVIIELAF